MPIQRAAKELKLKLTNSAATSPSIETDQYSTITVCIPAGYNSTALTVYVHSSALGTWLALNDAAGNAVGVSSLAAGEARNIPAEAFNADRIRLVTDNASDNSTDVGVILKA